ncbi:MAG: hypothetical protein K2J82_01570 [Muribaculaceae bacterium]|nr:hypothetical protein [Muribaculaceae bacterium]MDE6753282.1 hypothetical protein [Muribaculaceae bacterium]
MRISKITFALLVMLIITGCGKKQELPEALSSETTTIDGNMGEYYEVVEGSYDLDKYSSGFAFDVKCIKNTPEVSYTKLGIGYEIYDEDGKVVDSKNATLEDIKPLDSYEFLSLEEGEMGKVKVYLNGWPDKLKGAKTFKISINAKGIEESVDTAADNKGAASSSSNNWDTLLDEYEQYCNKLASMSKKALAGDVSVMTEYSSALDQAQRLSDKLENAQGEMTPAQVARLNKIAAKMAQSMM